MKKQKPVTPPVSTPPPVPPHEAFLEEAKKESQRVLLLDHCETIRVLREEKKFTFRAIAEWLTARGIKADHSAVYRIYLLTIPEEQRDPRSNWDHVKPECDELPPEAYEDPRRE